MKEFKRTGKKVLSVFLAALMVMTAWVFVAPEKAEAASAGSYFIRVYIDVTSKADYSNGYAHDKKPNDHAGVSIMYKSNNGTDGTVKWSDRNLKNVVNSNGKKTVDFTLDGFPVGFYIACDNNNWFNKGQWHVYKVEVGSSESSLKTIWTGTAQVSSYSNPYYAQVEMDGTTKAYAYGTTNTDGDNYVNDSNVSNWKAPVATTVTISGGSTSLIVPTNAGGSVSSNAYTAGTVYDQYGVSWYQDATLSANYAGKITFSNNKITATNAKSNASSDYTVTVTAKCGNAKATSTCTIKTFKYKATFYDEDGTTVLKNTQDVVYNSEATRPENPTKAPDKNYHYTFTGWSPSVGALTTGAQEVKYVATYNDKNQHIFEWKTDKEASCTETGLKHEECNICHFKQNEGTEIPKNPHNFTGMNTSEAFLKSAATCTDAAVYYYKCSVCGVSSKGITDATYTNGNPLGHKYGEWIIDKNPTCTETGSKHRVCERDSSHVETQTISENGHSWDTAFSIDVEATCTAVGSKSRHCKNCDAKINVTEIPKKDHTPGAAATCETAQICTVCKTELVPALGHDYSKTSTDSTHLASAATCTDSAVYYKSCSRCSKNGTETFVSGDPLGHNMGEWYEVKASECLAAGSQRRNCTRDKCDYFETKEIPAAGHNWGEWKVTKNETCTATGVDTRVCKRDSSHIETRERPALGHNFASNFTVDKKPTCTETGIESKHCSRCDATTEVTVIPANGHNYGEWITDDKATCTKAGTKHRICSVCQNREDGTIPALGHNWESAWTVDLKQSCTAVGSKSHHCTRCDEKTDITEIPKDPHSFEWVTDREPLCWQVGLKHEECTVCHLKQNEGTEIEKIDHTPGDWEVTTTQTCTKTGEKKIFCTVPECHAELNSAVIPADGHTDGEWIIDKNSSCTVTGEKHQICSVCGVTIKTESIPLKDHTLVHEHKDATCTENGYDRNRCSVCNGIFDEKILGKLGHDPKVVSDTQPTCYHDGLYKKVCARENCGVVLETQVRPKLGHIYGEGVKHDADCTKGEYVEYVCTRPGCSEDEPGHIKTEVYSNMQALGHDWTQWTNDETKTPTCDTPGEQYRLCNRCHIKETREISKLGHNMKAGEPVEASCLSGAYTPYTCSNDGCDFSYRIYDDSKPATDHTWVTTTSQEGNVLTVTCECSVCHKTHTKEVTVDEVHNYSVVSEVKAATCKEAGKIRITCNGAHKEGCTEFIEVETPMNANAHNYVTEKVGATCKTEGYVLSKCSICGNEIKTTLPTTAHAWNKGVVTKPATCTETGIKTFTCSICGDTYTEVIAQLRHEFELKETVAPTCKDGGKSGYKVYKCKNCTSAYNEITSDAISHNWSAWTVTQKPTDKLNGIEEHTCSVCGEKQLRTIAPIGDHTFVEDTATKKAATCTEDGSVTMKCTAHDDCGVTYEKVLPKLGHNMTVVATVSATCEHDGYADYKCSRCTHSYRIVTEAIKAHTLKTETQKADCLNPSVTYTYCEVCEKLEGTVTVGKALGHNFTREVSFTAPTNDKNGEKVLGCSRCEETITVVVPAEGHEFELVSTDEATCAKTGLQTYKCKTHTDCGLSYTNVIPMKPHTYSTRVKTAANCTTAGEGEFYCTVCGETFGEYDILALGHNFTVETENVPSTCNTVGHVTKKCSRCEETETTYSSTLAEHSWGDWKTEQEKTDVLPKIEVRECSVCHVYDYKYTQPAGAHAWDGGVVTKAATCTEEGVRTYTCTKADGTCSCTADTKASYTEKIPATGHTAKVEVKEATCKEAGYVKAVCQNDNCPLSGRVIDEKVLPKKDHVEKVTVVEATCTTPGSRSYTCAVCGEKTKETETIPTVPHAYEATGEFVEATCTSPKYEKYRCTYCSDEKLVKIGEAAGHTVDESKTATEPATCTTAGSVSKYCSCGQLLSVDVVNPTEHTWETVTVKLPKECDGATVAYEKCSVCGSIKADSVKINESGEHEYVVTTETPATCTTAGTLRITCNHCANVNTTVSVPAVGHTYDDGVITTEQTCKQNGIVTFTCTREGCTDAQAGHTLTKNIGRKNHNYLPSGEPVAATCTSSGYQLYKCDYCDTEFKEILGAPASHVYEKQSTSTEPTCNKDGHYYFKCKNCDASYDYVVSKTGNHTYASKVTQEKTCVLPEITTYTCETKGCGESYIQISADPTGHSFGEWKVTKEPTETENGEQVRKCNNCDETETAPIPAKIHNWGATPIAKTDASCTAAATETYQCIGCDICNAENGFATYVKTVGVPLQHMVVVDYVAATCAKDGSYVAKCTLCKEEFVKETLPATGHSFNTYLQDSYIPSTCQKEGSMTFACSNKDCHETKVEKLPVNPNAHNMVVDDANSQTATCTEAAYTAYKCANEGCTHVYKKWTSDPTAHTAKDEWTVKKDATCSSNGYEVRECKDCGIVMDSRTIEADPALHVWKTVEVKADHTKSGYSYEQCENCGAMRNFKTEALVEHDYTERVAYEPATPEANGSVTYKCACGDEKTFVIPATGCKFKEDTDRYVAPTCVADGTKYYVCEIHKEACANNYTETVPALGHKAGDVELTPATCIAEGSAVVTCTRENCGAELSRVTINKLPHTFSETNKKVVESTCQTHGTVTYTCTTEGCDATLKEELSLAEHKYKKISSVAPTCLDSGYDVFKCENCDANYHQVTVSANGHSYELVNEIHATCSTNGHVYYECRNCPADNKAKYDYDIPATGIHTYTETVTVDAKCETAGYTYIKCADCDSIKKDSVKSTDPLGHNYTVDMGNGVMKCARCDKTIVAQKVITDESGVHSLIGTITKTPTCTEEGVMTYVCQNHKDCKQNHEDPIPVTDHYVTVDSIVKTEPLCKQDGSLVDGSLVVNCAHCGKEIQKTVLPASHKFKITDVKKPNCNKEGTITEVCDDCGYIRYTYIAIDPSAHNFNYSAPVMEIKATCETDGYTVYGCTHCDAQKIVMTSPKLAHRNTTVTTVSAKCESDGYIRTTCDDCKKILSEETIPMTGHKNTRTVTVDATCTKAGSVTVVCADCNDVLSATVLDPTGHTWGEWKRIDGATCEKEGTEKRVCLKCGDFETRQVGKGQHVYEVYKVVAPTCESEGYTVHKCRVCGHTYNDNYVEKTAHRYDGSMVVIVEPTCHSTGLKAQKCVYCGKVDSDKTHYYEIKMLSHNYGDWTVLEEAKCDSNGLKQRTCINEGCPEGFEGHTETKVISKIGHNYGEWTVTKQATCIAEGERQRTCDRCGYVDKEATAKGEHKRVPDYPVEPTCTSYGLTGGNHCEVCGEVFVAQQVIPMKNHLDINGDGKCDGCGSPTYKPDSVDTCLCHKTGIASIFYKIARFFWKILKINQTCVCGAKHY